MKILLFSHRTPYPPNKGTQVRPFNMLTSLVALGHEVHLIAFAEDDEELATKIELEKYCASATLVSFNKAYSNYQALVGLLGNRPLSCAYFESKRMNREVNRIVKEFGIQAMVVFSSTMCQFVPPEFTAHSVVDMVDVDSQKWRDYAHEHSFPMSIIYKIEGQRLRLYEYKITEQFPFTVLTTEREIAVLDELDEETIENKMVAVTNGVDLEKFKPNIFPAFAPENLPAHERQHLQDKNAPRIVFTGAMDYYPNAEGCRYFAEEIFPLIRAEIPNAQFLIVGSKPTPMVQALSQNAGVIVTGFVDDVRPYLAAATVGVVPLKIARGIQNKALEAMASGRALVVTSSVNAGVGATHDQELLVADEIPDFAQAVLKVMRDEGLRQRLETKARSFVEEHYGWLPLMKKISDLVEIVGKR